MKTKHKKPRNLVAKHARAVNKTAVHTDKKKAAKRGDVKHANQKIDDLAA